MKENFKGYYQLTKSQLQVIWNQAVFILDTNVLLDIYRLPETTRNELLEVFNTIRESLWIPHQVALEYQEDRLSVIDDQITTFQDVEKALKSAQEKLHGEIEKLQLAKRHSLIKPNQFLEDVNRRFDEFRQELNELKKQQPNVEKYDELREKIDALFEGRVGPAPESQDELDEIYEEGGIRYERNQPPGYCDKGKRKNLEQRREPTAYLYRGLVFEREFGDLILWKEIIKEARIREGWNHIIFVTSEVKEDWWWKFKRSGSRQETLIGPRPELVAEIIDEAGISTFAMYQPDSFLKAAKELLGIHISEDFVTQVGDVVQAARERQDSSVAVRRFFPITDKHFIHDSSPQKIVVRFSNRSKQPLCIHRILYSDAVSGLPMAALRPYAKNDMGRLVVYSNMEGEKVFPGEDFVLDLELLAKWEPADIYRWAGEWGYLRLLVTLEDSPEEEIEEFYSI